LRFERLDFVAFGPFTDRSLVLGGAPGGLHLIYGRNAAGKSSALRAISDLLFGFPTKSSDDHVHPYAALRVRGTLSNAQGDPVVVQRLKRAKDSLRDAEDAPLDEVVLKRLLGNVDRAMFERVFGLDHERLRDAGVSLLEGGGDVGESLFDAGTGGQGVRRVLVRLREEAEKLFKPRGANQEIPQLLERYKAAREHVRNTTNLPEAYLDQQRELERYQAELLELSRELSELRLEREQSRLLQTTLKGVAKRAKLLNELSALGELPELPVNFGERREKVTTSLISCQANIERAERDVARLTHKRSELNPPEGLLSVGEETITLLREGIGSTKKALQDLPSREARVLELRGQALAMEQRLGIDAARLPLEALRARRPEEARFRRLLAERAALSERRRALNERLAQTELDLATRQARLAVLPLPGDVQALERAVQLARHYGDLEGTHSAMTRERAELDVQARAELATLSPFDGSLAELCALRVPAREVITRFEQSFLDLTQRAERNAREIERLRGRAAELVRELSVEEQAGAVPSEQELDRARGHRDERFDDLWKNPPEKPSKGLSLFEAARLRDYRASVTSADALADRLRREAARVAETARRRAELQQVTNDQAEKEHLGRGFDDEKLELEQAWATSWQAAGFEPIRPTEMLAWLARRERAVALVVKETTLAEQERELSRKREELRSALGLAVGELPEALPLGVAVARAQERMDAERGLAAERNALNLQLAELSVRVGAARKEVETSESEALTRESELTQVIASMGFASTLAAEEVEARLEALSDLLRTREQLAELERRVSGIKRDVAAFEAEVVAVVSAHANDLAELPSARAASDLVARFDKGRRDAETLTRLQDELAERSAELEEQRALLKRNQTEAETLLSAARATQLEDLPAIEARTRSARELRAELDGLDATLTEAAGPRGLSALLQEANATNPAQLSARLEDLDERVERLEERQAESIRGQQRIQAGLELFSSTSAVESAEEERALAAALIARSERWAQLKLSEVLLSREIERYREQNQGPVLRRAASLFQRLTHDEYRGLRLGREERTLVAVRANDLEVPVEGLNEAARYHLYLALRLASLERYLEHAETLPLVLDDVLIHFDEEGARSALSVLGDFAERTQVLLFTHHRHNVALAEAAVPAGRLFVHEL